MASLSITPAGGGGAGNVIGPATNTDVYIPQWDGANSKTLKNGLAVPAGGLAGLTALADKAPIANPTLTGTPAAPTAGAGDSTTQLATTAFVQQAVRSVPSKEASEYATIAALPTVVYDNGASGVGATLTGFAVGALGVDSASPAVADRILVKNQADNKQNGIYTVTATGSGIAVFVMTRALDFNQQIDIKTGAATYIAGGTTLAATTWDVNSADSPVMGTDAITFIQSAGPGSIIAGTGISISGVTVGIDTSVTADLTTAQTFTNKTLTSPKINENVAITATATELNYVDGVTSAIQTQLNAKAASLGADDNYVTDAQLVVIGNTSGTNTGNQDLSGYELLSNKQTDLTASATKYPTVNAVITGLTAKAPSNSPVFTTQVTIPVALTGVVRADSGVLSIDTDVTDIVAAASTTAQGKVELATDAETNTGTDTTRAITPSNLEAWTGSAQITTVGTLASPAMTTPALGTPSAVVLTNATGLPAASVVAGTLTGAFTLSGTTSLNLTIPTSDHSAVGNVTNAILSGATVAAFNLVFLGTGGKWLLVDADAVATCKGMIGIALEAKNDTQAMLVALGGSFVRDDTWAWTIGDTLYAGETPGAMQNAIPTGADAIIKVVGFAVSADVIYFTPSSDQQSVVA